MSAELDKSDTQEVMPYQGESWDSMVGTAHEVTGADFSKGNALLGVPFMLVHMTLRPGDYRHGVIDKKGELIDGTGCGKKHPYAYLRCVIAPERDLKRAVQRGRLTEENAELFEPGEQIGWLEAGTGVYRQVLAYLESQGYVVLPEGPPDGHFGESRFDSLPESWEFLKGETRFGPDGEPVYSAELRLHAPRGLRESTYENDYTKEGITRYFA